MSTTVESIVAVAGRVCLRSGCLQMLELLQGLSTRGCEVALVCARVQAEVGSRQVSFPTHTWAQVTGRWPSLRGDAAFQELLQQRKVQVVHVHGTRLGRTGHRFLKSVAVPVVFTPHSVDSGLGETRQTHRRAGRVAALSEHLREGLMNRGRVPREKLVVVPPGLEVNSYELHLPLMNDRAPIVGTVAPLEPGRGQSDFLEAARLVLDAGLAAEFVVAGDGPAEQAIRRQAEALRLAKHVTFVTRISDYADIISVLDVFVRPTESGGIGHTVLLAMAMGKPAVVIATGSMLEIVEDGNTGLVVPKKSPAALAAAIEQLLRDPPLARKMGQAARQRVVEQFSMDRLVKQTLRMYAEALH